MVFITGGELVTLFILLVEYFSDLPVFQHDWKISIKLSAYFSHRDEVICCKWSLFLLHVEKQQQHDFTLNFPFVYLRSKIYLKTSGKVQWDIHWTFPLVKLKRHVCVFTGNEIFIIVFETVDKIAGTPYKDMFWLYFIDILVYPNADEYWNCFIDIKMVNFEIESIVTSMRYETATF